MALLQALLTLIGRSASKILNAVFGWAVLALFGHQPKQERTKLSAVVAAAAVWPLLLLGIIVPKVAALVLAFVPLPRSVPSWMVRVVWLALAFAVPIVVGLVVAKKGTVATRQEPFLKRLARGFPITVALAAAFLFMFVSVPIRRIWSLVRKIHEEQLPLITEADAYHPVAAAIFRALNSHGFQIVATEPSWVLTTPMKILRLGGKAFRGFAPDRMEYFAGPGISVALYPSNVVLRGEERKATWGHGLLAEGLTPYDALQTFDSNAQAIERTIRAVWRAKKDGAPERELRHQLAQIAKKLGGLAAPYDEWQVVYRQALQLDRAIDGDPQLLDAVHQPAVPTAAQLAGEARGLFAALFRRPAPGR